MEAPKMIYLNIGKSGVLFANEEPQHFDGLADNSNTKYIRAELAELTWEDMVEIRRIMFNINKRISTFGLKIPSDEEYGKEVLSRFLESKKEG